MKKLLVVIFSFMLLLAGCSDKEEGKSVNLDSQGVSGDQEIEELQKLLEERPNVTSAQLRMTMNQTFRVLDAMIKKDYNFLESVVDENVTVDRVNNSFKFNDINQNFLKTVDLGKLEYRGINVKEDEITINFAENNNELVFRYRVGDENILLKSFLTN